MAFADFVSLHEIHPGSFLTFASMGRARPIYNEKARASSRKPTQKPHPNARNGGIIKEDDESPVTASNDRSGGEL